MAFACFDSIPHDSLGAVSSPHGRHFSYHQDVTKAGGKRKPRRTCIRIKLFLNYLSVRKAWLRFSTNICSSVTCTQTFKVRKPESFPKATEKVQLTQPAHHQREINVGDVPLFLNSTPCPAEAWLSLKVMPICQMKVIMWLCALS